MGRRLDERHAEVGEGALGLSGSLEVAGGVPGSIEIIHAVSLAGRRQIEVHRLESRRERVDDDDISRGSDDSSRPDRPGQIAHMGRQVRLLGDPPLRLVELGRGHTRIVFCT